MHQDPFWYETINKNLYYILYPLKGPVTMLRQFRHSANACKWRKAKKILVSKSWAEPIVLISTVLNIASRAPSRFKIIEKITNLEQAWKLNLWKNLPQPYTFSTNIWTLTVLISNVIYGEELKKDDPIPRLSKKILMPARQNHSFESKQIALWP